MLNSPESALVLILQPFAGERSRECMKVTKTGSGLRSVPTCPGRQFPQYMQGEAFLSVELYSQKRLFVEMFMSLSDGRW